MDDVVKGLGHMLFVLVQNIVFFGVVLFVIVNGSLALIGADVRYYAAPFYVGTVLAVALQLAAFAHNFADEWRKQKWDVGDES